MKALLIGMLMALSTTAQAQTKCDWSEYSMFKSFQRENYYEYRTNLHWDSCIDYTWLLYDYQLKRTDTLAEVFAGFMRLQLNKKGKYQIQLKATNRCKDCDTTFYEDITMTVYGSAARLNYSVSASDCRSLTFEAAKMDDSCISNFYEIWDFTEFTKEMTDRQWKAVSDSSIYFEYDWNGINLVYAPSSPTQKMKFDFADSGRYLVIAYWVNLCNRIDTFTFNRIVVCPKELDLSVKNPTRESNVSVIGYYDMLGRRVDAIEPDKVYIILYSNGQRRKSMQVGR